MNPFHFPATPSWLWWAYPWVLALALVIPLMWRLWLRRDRRPVLRFSSLHTVQRAGGAVSRRVRLILPALRTAALLCLLVAVARPRQPDETTSVFAEGVAILLVVDTSGSMEDLDLSPGRNQPMSRLDVVKEVIRRFVGGEERDDDLIGRKNDLIGMIRFARFPDAICPLTLDHESLLEILRGVRIVTTREDQGTAIGDALGLAVERLREVERTSGSGEKLKIVSRVVILLTDGENNSGMISPEQAGDLAARHGIKVYTILAGTGENTGLFRRPVDDSQLRYIAEQTHGLHFRARDRRSLAAVYDQIDKLERTRVEERTNLRWGELSLWWLVAAFACLSMQMFLEATRLRKIP